MAQFAQLLLIVSMFKHKIQNTHQLERTEAQHTEVKYKTGELDDAT